MLEPFDFGGGTVDIGVPVGFRPHTLALSRHESGSTRWFHVDPERRPCCKNVDFASPVGSSRCSSLEDSCYTELCGRYRHVSIIVFEKLDLAIVVWISGGSKGYITMKQFSRTPMMLRTSSLYYDVEICAEEGSGAKCTMQLKGL